jgi:tetratricopeptide (TPR) repeat protein
MNQPAPAELLLRAESMLSHSPVAAVAILERTADDPECPAELRVEALALLAQHVASDRSARGLTEARSYLTRADALRPGTPVARGRLTLSRGYIAFREAQDDDAIRLLHEAASLLDGVPRLRARAFDTLGMLLSRRGDLDGAHDFFTTAVDLKKSDPAGADPHSLALTYGNLGRLELTRARFAEAERWLRLDLAIILVHDPKPATEAHVRSQLAQALEGLCPGREADVRAELERAQQIAPRGSVTALYVLKNVALLALREGRPRDAQRALQELRDATARQRFAEFDPWLSLIEGRVLRAEGSRASLDAAASRFEEAHRLFSSRQMPQEACDAVLDWAEALAARGDGRRAAAVLEGARDTLEAPPSQRDALVARLEARLATLDTGGLLPTLQNRLRRLFGGAAPDPAPEVAPATELPSSVTVCVLELRGDESLWTQDRPAEVQLARAGRVFGALAVAVGSVGAEVDRLGPDRLILHFPGGSAAGRAVEAVQRARARLGELVAEQALDREALRLAAGVSVGWAKRHEVQGPGAVERGWWGPAISGGCRLAGAAEAGEILLDAGAEATAPAALKARLRPRELGGLSCFVVEG